MDKQIVVYSYNRILFNNLKNELLVSAFLWGHMIREGDPIPEPLEGGSIMVILFLFWDLRRKNWFNHTDPIGCILTYTKTCMDFKTVWYGVGNGNPLQYSCLENPLDRRGWWATVRGVAKSQTQLIECTHTHSWFIVSFSCITVIQ